jgi:hypothetical protein
VSRPILGTLICLVLGIGLLTFLGLVPLLFSTYTVQPVDPNASPPAVKGMIEMNEDHVPVGRVVMFVSFGIAGLCLISLVFLLTPARTLSEVLLTFSALLAGGWGITALFGFLGYVWDIYSLKPFLEDPQHVFESLFGRLPGTLSPGLGLWLGLGAAAVIVLLFAMLLTLRGRALWLYLGEGVGLTAGLLVLFLWIKPWDLGAKLRPVDVAVSPLRLLETKYGQRYWPLRSDYALHHQLLEKLDQQRGRR